MRLIEKLMEFKTQKQEAKGVMIIQKARFYAIIQSQFELPNTVSSVNDLGDLFILILI